MNSGLSIVCSLALHAAPLPVVSADQDQTVPQLMTPKDDNMCLLPQCRRERYKEPDGTLHPFCGRTHANLAREMNIEGMLCCIN